MPNRIIRDWTDSEKIDNLSVQAERFFTRLIMKVDDYGRYNANHKFLKSTLFPLRTDIRETDIDRWLAECERSSLIVLYKVTSKDYVQIENFKQVLRQKTEKYPSPEKKDICIADDKQMTSIRHASASLKRIEVEVETEGEGHQDATHTPEILESYKKFNEWIKLNTPNILKIKNQISIENFLKLKQAYPDMKKVVRTIESLHNYKNAEKKYLDVYLTLKKWISKDE